MEIEDELDTFAAIEAAWDQSEETELEEPNELRESEVLEATDESDNATEAERSASDAELRLSDGGDEAAVHGSEQSDNKQPKDKDDEKPPVGLSATAREAWKDTPKAMKDELQKREKDYAQGIQRYAEDAKRVQQMDRTLEPYKQLFAMNGGASQFMPNLLQTAAILQMGSQPQKAQMLANMIHQFGVDIGTLDAVLTGAEAPRQQAQPQVDVNQIVEQRFQQEAQWRQQQEQQQMGTEAVGQINTFGSDPKNEFYADVRVDMADILEMATNRGQILTLKQAYDKACQLNPEISAIVSGRTSKESAAKKRRAASPIRGTLGGEGGASGDSMRSAIEDAWAEQGQL